MIKKLFKVVIILCVLYLTACNKEKEDMDSKLTEIKQEFDSLHPTTYAEKFEVITPIPIITPLVKEPTNNQEITNIETISDTMSLVKQDLCDAIALQFYGLMPPENDYISLAERLKKYMTLNGCKMWGDVIYEIGGCTTNISEDPNEQVILQPGTYAYTKDENGLIAEILSIEEYKMLYGEPAKEDIVTVESYEELSEPDLKFEFVKVDDETYTVIVTDNITQETRKFTITFVENLLDSIREENK